MKIVYFTTAIQRDDYKAFYKLWNISLNPSNQNFHNKMIRSLAINNTVDVISIRPFSKRKCLAKYLTEETKEEDNITWHYIKIKGTRLKRHFTIKKEVAKLKAERDKLEENLGGIKEMRSLPGVIFIVDPDQEDIAVMEARKLGLKKITRF